MLKLSRPPFLSAAALLLLVVVGFVTLLGKPGRQLTPHPAASCGLSPDFCPGSPAPQHARCSIAVAFEQPCEVVQEEVEARIARNADRKSHPGAYALLASAPAACTKGSRHTAVGAHPSPADVGMAGEYFTDFFGLTYQGVGGGCRVAACSESQGMSLCDFSTNFCNVFNLFCNSTDGCTSLVTSLKYELVATGEDCFHTAVCTQLSSLESGAEADPAQCAR
ncbi:hypothetical protein AB1Y20_018772 [Prymnesium parvum]|uniref:Uncharacterized protein n=1 Tax=Prymnesium parvum TaxID=97485 RepID=A0AB34JPN7_PRYPA